MPTWERVPQFDKSLKGLSPTERGQFKAAVEKFVEDLRKGDGLRGCRQGLRVKGYKSCPGVWEMSWASNGRALFLVGESKGNDDPHIIWLDIGDHTIL